jgi:hypothetical protein
MTEKPKLNSSYRLFMRIKSDSSLSQSDKRKKVSLLSLFAMAVEGLD